MQYAILFYNFEYNYIFLYIFTQNPDLLFIHKMNFYIAINFNEVTQQLNIFCVNFAPIVFLLSHLNNHTFQHYFTDQKQIYCEEKKKEQSHHAAAFRS